MKSKMKKIILIIGIVLILIVVAVVLLRLYNKDIEERSNNVAKAYDGLVNEVNTYNTLRTDIIEFIDNFYYTTINSMYDDNKELLDEYSDVVNNITSYIDVIKENCKRGVNDNVCDKYQTTYEKLINIYVKDINNYNNKITSYNTEATSLEDYQVLEVYKGVFTDYIDYNNDSEYEEVDA